MIVKAQIVARGFQQKEDIDYHKVFVRVVRWKIILVILTLAAKHNEALSQMDMITTFLNGTITEDILIETLEGFLGGGDSTKVYRINRVLYGLKQAPKVWYDRINQWLQKQGLTRSANDPNLYFKKTYDKLIILLLYVNDLLITGDDAKGIADLKQKLQFEFEMTDLGEANNYLGIEINRTIQSIFINQRRYV